MSIFNRVVRKLRQKIDDKHRDPAKNTNGAAFEVDNWLLSDFIVKKLMPVVGVRPYPIAELNLMVSAICRFKPEHQARAGF